MTSVKRLAGAVALGLGSFLGHRRPDQHWTERQDVELPDDDVDAPEGDDLDDAAMAAIERRLAATETSLAGVTGDDSLCDLGRSGLGGPAKDLEGRLAALLDARREVRRGADARLAVGVTVAAWEASLRTAQQQGPQWLAYRWGGADELHALAEDLADLDRA